ncbi:protein of unknown function [Denitratisoma oestradiolicum]|uniref:Uncharacterized protein n=1 Tax=Denitratisoma oestradiolicum TaxID=311182 RepID=A0A6S6XUB4_9PROT|nr:protein of unknown function [Denitratisoma oestradiolicum]
MNYWPYRVINWHERHQTVSTQKRQSHRAARLASDMEKPLQILIQAKQHPMIVPLEGTVFPSSMP